ncbi:DUF5686 and carboxypeptidase regulatory-like domain-containing protein [Maribellus sediminis]|uniref:DUF5686 and carboxypeptidase regulatory-like domain-containing protein n=1 Tax=Maribellus sediminis TaxID=2696285 RepID=UPI00142F7BFC|nr:DUF5686 and carboxypeptidase regulatory-like domain-containing protein [Maribellus sediminis]
MHPKKTKTRGLLVLLLLILFISNSIAQVLSGKITDEQNRPIPYATIYVSESREGTTSNADGNFQFQLAKGNYHLTVRSMGYLQKSMTVQVDRDSIFLPVVLQVQEFELEEVKIFPGKEDPAYFIMRKAIAKAPFYREKIKHYVADLYIKANFEFTNIPKIIKKQEVEDGKKFKDYFKENVTYVMESQNKITFDYPNHYDQKVISKQTSLTGIDEPPVMGLMTTSYYEERPEQVISPLSTIALKHYNFRYEGFIKVGDFDVFKIEVTPKRKSDELVGGYIYIVDKLWCIYNLDFSSTFEFVDYRIKQQFENLGNENWLPVSHNISGKLGLLGMRANFYYGASVKYDSIVDNYTSGIIPEIVEQTSSDSAAIKEDSEKTKELKKQVEQIAEKEELSNADVKKLARLNRKILKEEYMDSTRVISDTYSSYNIDDQKDSLRENVSWDTIRAIPLTPAEVASYHMADSLRSMETPETDTLRSDEEKRKSKFSKIVFGSYDLYKDSLTRVRYSGLINLENFDFNAVDGYKYKQSFQLRYNPDSAKYIYLTPEIGYAFNRKAVFGSFSARLVNILGDGNQLEVKAGKMSHDFKSEYGIDPVLNALSTWFFAENYMKLYETEFVGFGIFQRLNKQWTVALSSGFKHFYPLENHATYLLNDKKEFKPNLPGGIDEDNPALMEQKSFAWSLGLNHYKRIRKPWLQESPFLFIDDYYRVQLNFKQGLKGVFASVSDYSQIDFTFEQQANISPTSGIVWKLNAGYFLNADQLHFSEYKHFQTSEIPVAFIPFTNTLQLLNDYEPASKEGYINLSGEYRSEYVLLRYLSFVNRKTWSESLHLNYFSRNPGWENYWEAGYSLNNVFFAGNVGFFAGFLSEKFESFSVKLSISIND